MQVNIAIVPVVVAHLLQLHHQLISMANGRHLFFILFSEHFVIFYAINHWWKGYSSINVQINKSIHETINMPMHESHDIQVQHTVIRLESRYKGCFDIQWTNRNSCPFNTKAFLHEYSENSAFKNIFLLFFLNLELWIQPKLPSIMTV